MHFSKKAQTKNNRHRKKEIMNTAAEINESTESKETFYKYQQKWQMLRQKNFEKRPKYI